MVFNTNRKTEMIMRRQNELMDRKCRLDIEAMSRDHARALADAEDRRVREVAEEKRKRLDMKAKWRKEDHSFLEATEEHLVDLSTAISDFIPRMEDITQAHRFQQAFPAKLPFG
jgi:uncharacterized protein YqfA (UPF0365 family)